MKNHPLYETCRRAHSWITFNPERRAEQELTWYEENLAEFATLCGDDTERFADIKAKYTKKFLELMGAKSRCASSAITGGSGFNVARAEKANKAEHTKSGELSEWLAKVRKSFAPKTGFEPIMAGNPDALELLQAKVDKLKANHELYKAANKIIQSKLADADKILALETALSITMEQAIKLLKPDFCGRLGFPSYILTNNLAAIKQVEGRIATLANVKNKENLEQEIRGVKILHNFELMRLQLFFNGKPSQATIASLKSHGFKWSPSNMAWQRQLTENAKYSTGLFFKTYEA